MSDLVEKINIVRIQKDNIQEKQDRIVRETPLTIVVNGEELVTLLCLPEYQRSLAVGFLYSEGIIKEKSTVKSLSYNSAKGVVWVDLNGSVEVSENFTKSRTITTGCTKGISFQKVFDEWEGEIVTSNTTVEVKTIFSLLSNLKIKDSLYMTTGGTHTCVLCNNNEMVLFREDIGRHNAIDKIIGDCILNDIKPEDKFIITSGRISSEILFKVARFGVPILISRGAPTSISVKLADELGVTLVGFARAEKLNIYTHRERIK